MKYRFNWKHIVFHFIGIWLISHAGIILAYLENVEVAEIIRLSKSEKESLTGLGLGKLAVSQSILFVIGYVIATGLAFYVSGKIKCSWVNSVVALVAFFLLIRLGLSGWIYLKQVFLFPGSYFNGWSFFTANGLMMVLVGLYFIFGIKRFYKEVRHAPHPQSRN